MKDPARLLVIQLRRIGDVLLTTPAVSVLRRRFPKATLDFLVEPPGAEALKGNPDIDEVLVYRAADLGDQLAWFSRLRQRGYDWVIDYLGNPRSAFLTYFSEAKLRAGPAHVGHRWAYNHLLTESTTTHYAGQEKINVLKTLGIEAKGADFLPKVYFTLDARATNGNKVALAPASRKITRRWPAASYAALGRLFRDKQGCELLVFWGPGERELAEEVAKGIGTGARTTPETKTLEEAALLLAGCRLLVTNCSGTKHLACAVGVPTLTIHGSSDPMSWTPAHPHHKAVRLGELHCIGCQKNVCPYALECMTQLAPETVYEAALPLLRRQEARA